VDNIVKQRLVGALILLALGVVFWPIIFVPDSRREAPVTVTVPEAPPVDLSPLPEPDNLGLENAGPAAAEALPDVDVPASELLEGDEPLPALPARDADDLAPSLESAGSQLEQPALDEDGLPVAFTLQVATMAGRERAEALRDELVAAGYKGYLKRLRRNDRVLWRVLVGPKYTREELEPVKEAIDENWRVESLIMRYLP
jgi:DedD protein